MSDMSHEKATYLSMSLMYEDDKSNLYHGDWDQALLKAATPEDRPYVRRWVMSPYGLKRMLRVYLTRFIYRGMWSTTSTLESRWVAFYDWVAHEIAMDIREEDDFYKNHKKAKQ